MKRISMFGKKSSSGMEDGNNHNDDDNAWNTNTTTTMTSGIVGEGGGIPVSSTVSRPTYRGIGGGTGNGTGNHPNPEHLTTMNDPNHNNNHIPHDEYAEYIILCDPRSERHLGSLRILRTDRPHILGDVFPMLCEGEVPVGPEIRELTRLCLSPDLRAADRCP